MWKAKRDAACKGGLVRCAETSCLPAPVQLTSVHSPHPCSALPKLRGPTPTAWCHSTCLPTAPARCAWCCGRCRGSLRLAGSRSCVPPCGCAHGPRLPHCSCDPLSDLGCDLAKGCNADGSCVVRPGCHCYRAMRLDRQGIVQPVVQGLAAAPAVLTLGCFMFHFATGLRPDVHSADRGEMRAGEVAARAGSVMRLRENCPEPAC